MRIVIVDDHLPTLEATVEMMQVFGFSPIPFNSPELALKFVLENKDVFLVLTDRSMPEMTGPEFIGKIKAERPGVECILMTAQGGKETLLEVLRAGGDDYIEKPFDMDKMENVIRAAVVRLTAIPTLEVHKARLIDRARATCKTEKEAAEKLGVNYTTLYRRKKVA